jgi:hypothetical protein
MSSILDKLSKIEALIQRASSEGERQAARYAKGRILSTIAERQSKIPIEYKISFDSPWKKRLFITLCSKHGYKTYRYSRQKRTTAHVRIVKNIMEEMLWPEFLRYAQLLEELVEEIMKDLTNKIHRVQDEEIEIAGEIGL